MNREIPNRKDYHDIRAMKGIQEGKGVSCRKHNFVIEKKMKTLSEINNSFIDKNHNDAIRCFLWAMIIDRGIIANKKKLFYSESDKQTEDVFRVIDESYFKKYKPQTIKRIQFEPDKGVIKEFFDNKIFTLELPIVEWLDITYDFTQKYLWELAKERIIDDLLYTIIRNICSLMGVFYDRDKKIVWFWKWQKLTKIKSWNIFTTVKVRDINLEEVLASEIEHWYVNKKIWDPDLEYAYSHWLRAHAKFTMFWWARKVFMTWKKYNVCATSRWQGKTYLAALVAAKELLKDAPGFGGRTYREIKYFVSNKEDIGNQVMLYIESLLGDLIDKKVNWKPLFDMQRSKFTIRCNLTGNTFKIVSLHNLTRNTWELGNAIGEGIACDVAIIDEACRIPDAFWSSFHQRAAFETDTFFIISTINEETPVDHWFYKLLIDWETGDPDISSHRVTIDENEVMRQGRSKEEFEKILELAKSALRIKWEKEFYSKGFCIILEESNVFNTGSYVVPSTPSKYNDADPRILGFDLGKLTDTCWLVLINLKHREIEQARKVINATYGTQLAHAKEYKKKYPNLLIIGDRSWVGESVSEQDTDAVVDTWIKSTGAWELSYNKKYGFYTCNKGLIITTFATVMNSNILKIPADQTDLTDQMNTFVKMKSGRGEIILYKGKWKTHDDLVLSTAYAIIYMYSILWLKTIQDIEGYVSEIWNTSTYLYNDQEDGKQDSWYYNSLY